MELIVSEIGRWHASTNLNSHANGTIELWNIIGCISHHFTIKDRVCEWCITRSKADGNQERETLREEI